MKKIIAVLPGDGIGPEVMSASLEVLETINERYNHQFIFQHAAIGGAAFDIYGKHCPHETLEICQQSDAILFGCVGGPVDAQDDPKWQGCEANSILALRKAFNFGVNIRPIKMFNALQENSPLKNNRIGQGADIEIFRELSGDIYFGEHRRFEDENGVKHASDTAEYDENTIAHIVEKAFIGAQKRNKVLTSVDKANVLDTSRLWREVVKAQEKNFPDVKVNHMYVDNCAMQLVLNPAQFDVIVTANLFGDILSDLASVLPGSIGLIPSASLNKQGFGLYEPAGGSAFDIQGKNVANPIAQILSASLMLSYSFGLHQEAKAIQDAIEAVLKKGVKTADLCTVDETPVTTTQITQAIVQEIKAICIA
ncbi:3-isopropylmalate dehydrogenase [Facilibium subflavum]|uniref:3-isopropylmalate dehydrogenase n=1 Tax=Facilibium subflavum TaxID=2219058 RepID=UPI000E64B99B|nr:3-isopropylmalate dehydrogenase [Facilibium subflavum]